MRFTSRQSGFTLAEMLIAISIFAVVSLLGVMVFFDITQVQKKISLENNLTEDGRLVMEQLVRDIQANAIDYEEYFNKKTLASLPDADYGTYFGAYAEKFYNFGSGGYMGNNCTPGYNPAPTQPCSVDNTTVDYNLGISPAYSTEGAPESKTAMCINCSGKASDYVTQNDLYLISPDGKRKIFYHLIPANDDPDAGLAVGVYKMDGSDSDTDDNGMVDTFLPAENFTAPQQGAKITGNEKMYFVPITPSRTVIENLQFIITPIEDPRKAFAEPDMQSQPRVTILLTVKPSAAAEGTSGGHTLTLQTTISSRMFSEVKSFPARAVQMATD